MEHQAANAPVHDETEYRSALARRFGTRTDAILAQYPVSRFASANDAITSVSTDAFFACPARETALYAARASLPVRAYDFDMANPYAPSTGASHGAELFYFFVPIEGSATAEQLEVADAMRRYWVRFAARGDPNGGDDPEWPMFTPNHDVRLDLKSPIAAVTNFRADDCDFWRDLEVGIRF